MVPHEATVLMAARTDRPVSRWPKRDHRRATRPVPARGRDPNSNRVKVIYQVKRGDTLGVDRPALQDDGRVAQDVESADARAIG